MSRWLSETGGDRGASYALRLARIAASGAEMHGEAAFVDRLLGQPSQVLDAGCGTGRVAAELARRGHTLTGVDNDASMLDVARQSPDVDWRFGDLATLELGQAFDLVVAAGNVMVFLEPGTEPAVVSRLADHLAPGGLLVSGWRTDRLTLPAYEVWTAAAGLAPVGRFATWDGAPWAPDAAWCVAVDARTG